MPRGSARTAASNGWPRAQAFTLNPIPEAKAIERKIPGIFAETIEEGLLSPSPQVPDDDVQSIGLQWMLIAQSALSEQKGIELARSVFENKSQLTLDDGFGSHIEPADTDKDSFISAHRGAAQYFNDDTKSFLERYSELIYVGIAALEHHRLDLRRPLHRLHARRA